MKYLINYFKGLSVELFSSDSASNITIYSEKDENYYLTFHFFCKKEHWGKWGIKYEGHYDGLCFQSFHLGPFLLVSWIAERTNKCCNFDEKEL